MLHNRIGGSASELGFSNNWLEEVWPDYFKHILFARITAHLNCVFPLKTDQYVFFFFYTVVVDVAIGYTAHSFYRCGCHAFNPRFVFVYIASKTSGTAGDVVILQ